MDNTHHRFAEAAAFERFCRQPIGRAQLVIRDHVRSALNTAAARGVDLSWYAFDFAEVERLLSAGSELTLRSLAARFTAYRPNASDSIYVVRRRLQAERL